MNLLLHTPESKGELSRYYDRAFKNSVEIFVVTAFLTDWDASLKLNRDCRSFRVIIGKDFGITRKAACEKVMHWLPAKRKAQFLVADRIAGFHPKAVFWRESDGHCFAIVGSSNLTRAAFETNYEANVYGPMASAEYAAAKAWVKRIEKQAVVVSEDWLKKYKEAALPGGRGPGGSKKAVREPIPLVSFNLPTPRGMSKHIKHRREQLAAYQKQQAGLMQLFRRCASGNISSQEFYDQLPNYWGREVGDRLQGKGWERQGSESDFHSLSQSFVRILDATDDDRDDVVVEEIDNLSEQHVATRKAFLSEMLCLRFPEQYPVLNKPVQDYLSEIEFKAPRGATEGVRFVDLARKLRFSLLQNKHHPAKNLAELDTVIWLEMTK
jgi:HKD family nuclease